MAKVVTVEQMRAVEAAADRQGVTYADMMEHAGRAVAEAVQAMAAEMAENKITVLAGPGNNGGDGLVAARYLAEAGATVSVYLSKMRDDADDNLKRVREAGLFIVDGENDQRWRVLTNLMHGATVVVDGLLGTGAILPIKGQMQKLLGAAGRALKDRKERPLIVAIDCPSGLDCDSGQVDPATLAADLTVTLAAAKRGQLMFPAADFVGELKVVDIGIPADLPELAAAHLDIATAESVASLLPARPRNAHKGTFGRAIVVAGSINYTGAAYLAGAAAYRVGAGLVTLAAPMPLYAALASQLPEATWLLLPHEMGVISPGAVEVLAEELDKAQALVLGPGLGQEKVTGDFLRKLLRVDERKKGRIGFAQSAHQDEARAEPYKLPPAVIDADGLRLLAEIDGWPALLNPGTVLTPHPGEMAALTRLDKDEIQADRLGMALKFAAKWGHVIVLKGAFTVAAAPDGRVTIQPFATAALARAGTGDVLAGAIGGLLAQGLAPYEAAVAGAFVHGRAGEWAARRVGSEASVLASDVLAALPRAQAGVERLRTR